MQWGEPEAEFDRSHIEAVRVAVEALDPMSRTCIEAIFYEGVPYSRLGDRLGFSKPHAWRLSQRAMEQLGKELLKNSNVSLKYNIPTCWEDASMSLLKRMDFVAEPAKASIQQMKADQANIGKCVRSYKEIPVETIYNIGMRAIGQMKHEKTWDIDEMHDLLVSKQHDYGHGNILMFGKTGVGIRICDKIARLVTLCKSSSKAKNETLLDTWRDLVGYSVIAQMLEENTFTLELITND